jgi:hydroxylamine reductase
MSMFCYQCRKRRWKRLRIRALVGKTEEVAKLQDLLIYTLKGISEYRS